MTIIYRSDKGANLTAAEIDGNFHDVDDRLTFIEDNPADPVVPISATMTVGSYTLGFSNDTSYTVTFTMPQPIWRGNWQPGNTYRELDYFIGTDGGWGTVVKDHVSAATFDWAAVDTAGDALYLKLVGATGETGSLSNLTDVASSGAAPGDMLIWDGAYWYDAAAAEVTANLVPFVGDGGSGGEQGLVPAPAAGDATADKFLSASGAWAVPASGSGGSASLAGLTDVWLNSLINDSLLQYKSGDGKWHNSSLVDLGAGTVTSITAGSGLSGGTITAAGTIALAAAPAATLLVNTAGGSAPPSPATLTVALDALAGSTRGSLLQRDATGWQPLAPGTAGLFLRTGGSGADLTWASPAGNGTVTSITAGAGLSGGTITTSGTVALAAIADDSLLANVSGLAAPPAETSVTTLLDAALGTTRGSIIRRDGSVWGALAPGTAGHVLTSGGSGADVSWAPGGGSGANVSVGDAPPTSPNPNDLWWDSASGNLFIRFADPNSSAWVAAVNQPGPAGATGATGPAGPTGATGPAGQTWTVGSGLTLTSNTLSLTTPALPLAGGALSGNLTTSASIWAYGGAVGGSLLANSIVGATLTTAQLLGFNAYFDGGNWRYLNGTAYATGLNGDAGIGQWSLSITNAAGAAGTVASMTPRLIVDRTGACQNTTGSWTTISDASTKSNVEPYTRGLDAVLALQPVSFVYNDRSPYADDNKTRYGLVADEVRPHVPEAVGTYLWTRDDKDEGRELATLDPTHLVFVLINSLKELAGKNSDLEARLAALEAANA